MEINMEFMMMLTSALVFFTGIIVIMFILKAEKINKYKIEKGIPIIEAWFEYSYNSGELYYIVQNKGTATATDIQLYLPKCQEISLKRGGVNAKALSNAMAKIVMQKYPKLNPGQAITTPLVTLQAIDTSIKSVVSLGLDIEIEWSENKKSIMKDERIIQTIIKRNANYNNVDM